MNRSEIRYRATAALLQADGPVTLARLVKESGVTKRSLLPVLKTLVSEKLVVEGKLGPRARGGQYCWAARWQADSRARSAEARKRLVRLMAPFEKRLGGRFTIEGDAAVAFHRFIVNDYEPPENKRFLVFLQCSVRRPFSTSPSHGSMKRAIRVATGLDPRKERESCPVHVVVLASRVGPAPYDLEDVYPANVRSGGVKDFGPEHYARVKPILARRMADYICAHGERYERIATFTESRYGEVMAEARGLAGVDFPVLPAPNGARISAMGGSTPRTYWAKYWIQLYLEITSWLDPAARSQAGERLAKLEVTYTGGRPGSGSRRKPK